MRCTITVSFLMISFVFFGQASNDEESNDTLLVPKLEYCLNELNISAFKNFENKFLILNEICELYDIRIIDSISSAGGLFKLKKSKFLPLDYYSFSLVLVPIIREEGFEQGFASYDHPKLSQIELITEIDYEYLKDLRCKDLKPAYLLQSLVETLPKKKHEFGEFYTTSTYLVVDYETLYIISKGEISNQGQMYFSSDKEIEILDKFNKSKDVINTYR